MKVFNTVADLQAALALDRQQGKTTVGLVPTMGALHEGHVSLITRARKDNDILVVSVFVNPIQFNNQEDLRTYPRHPEADEALLRQHGVDYAFMPMVEEMYPEPVTTVYHFGKLDEVMEGPRRPGHFSGVAVVIRRLFDIVQPQRAYFGEKDYQQLAIIKELVRRSNDKVEIVACPIVREADGLAQSSRNQRLSPAARAVAPFIYATLSDAVRQSQSHTVEQVKAMVLQRLKDYHSNDGTLINMDTYHVFDPEYFEIVDDTTLQPINRWDEASGVVGCVAVWLTGVRLIDMVRFR